MMFSWIHVLVGLSLMFEVSALALDLCSSVNLGSSSIYNTYMSNGLCSDHCRDGGYSAAITQGYLCYCSNSVPADTVSMGRCNTGCPGYSQQENCGGSGVFGYVILGNPSTVSSSATSTRAASSSQQATSSSQQATSSSQQATSSSQQATSSFSSAVASSAPASSSVPPSSSSAALSSSPAFQSSSLSQSSSQPSAQSSSQSSSQSSPITSNTSSAPSPSPQQSSTDTAAESDSQARPSSIPKTSSTRPTSTRVSATTVVSIITVDGSTTASVSTKYITETSPASPTPSPEAKEKHTFFDSKGKVAGTFTAVGVVAVAALGTLFYCCCFGAGRSRQQYDQEMQSSSDESLFTNEKNGAAGAVSRSSSSPMSPHIKRNSSSKSILSIFNPAAASGAAAATPMGRSLSKKRLNPRNEPAQGGPIMFSIMEFDNVMDPALDVPSEHNKSKLSLNDDEDYSNAYQDRALHVANPE